MGNKREVFAKIIELKNYQVLIIKEYDEECDSYLVRQITEHSGIRISMSLGFNTSAKCNKFFKDYNENNAENFIKSFSELLK